MFFELNLLTELCKILQQWLETETKSRSSPKIRGICMLESTCNQICYETRWRKVTAQSAENSDVTGLIKVLGVLIKREDKRQKWFRDASELDWHKREITDKPNISQDKNALDGLDSWPHLKHITTSGWRDLYLCVWQIKDAIPAQI